MKNRLKWVDDQCFIGETESGHALVMDGPEEDPKVFTEIHFHFVFVGRGLDAAGVEKAINLSADKYSGGSIMLAKSAKFTRTFEIREAD